MTKNAFLGIESILFTFFKNSFRIVPTSLSLDEKAIDESQESVEIPKHEEMQGCQDEGDAVKEREDPNYDP